MGLALNGIRGDLYIGKGAGKKLLEEIRAARQEVKIVTPYVNMDFIEDPLILLHERQVQVKFITSNSSSNFPVNDRRIYRLIKQIRSTNEKAVIEREKYRRYTFYYMVVIILLSAFMLYKVFGSSSYIYLWLLVPVLLLLFIRSIYSRLFKRTSSYFYHYESLFPLKVLKEPQFQQANENSYLLHSKLYVIDNQIAYIGSFNLTKSGAYLNYETRFRITDPSVVQRISEEFDLLFNSKELMAVNLQDWGKQLYKEPLN